MDRDPERPRSSLPGNPGQRRPREIHKLRLSELPDTSSEEIRQMVATGDIELMVRRSDVADSAAGGWSKRIARLFEVIADGLEDAPEFENRTIFVNIVSGRQPGKEP